MLKMIKKIISLIDEICFSASAVAMTLLAFVNAIARYVFNHSILWAEEVLLILVVWSVFFGGSIAFRQRGHISVEIIFDKLPSKIQIVLEILIWILVTFAISWIGKLQISRMMKMYISGQSTTVLNIPRYIIYGVVAFACLLMLINHIICGIEDIKTIRSKAGTTDE